MPTGPAVSALVLDEKAYEKALRETILEPMLAQARSELEKAGASYYAMRERIRNIPHHPSLKGLAEDEAQKAMRVLMNNHTARFRTAMRKYIGVRVDLLSDTPIDLAARVADNVNLIVTIPPKFHDALSEGLFKLQAGAAPFDRQKISDLLRKQYKSSGYNLRRLTRDQNSKLIGQLNHVRQTEIGVEKYQWITSGDNRVRRQHVENAAGGEDGKGIFYWNDPPPDGHPGAAVQCRCNAVPVFPSKPFKPPKQPTGVPAAAALGGKAKAAKAVPEPKVAPKAKPQIDPDPGPPVETVPETAIFGDVELNVNNPWAKEYESHYGFSGPNDPTALGLKAKAMKWESEWQPKTVAAPIPKPDTPVPKVDLSEPVAVKQAFGDLELSLNNPYAEAYGDAWGSLDPLMSEAVGKKALLWETQQALSKKVAKMPAAAKVPEKPSPAPTQPIATQQPGVTHPEVFGDLTDVLPDNPNKHIYHHVYLTKGPDSLAAKEWRKQVADWNSDHGLKVAKAKIPAKATTFEQTGELVPKYKVKGVLGEKFTVMNPHVGEYINAIKQDLPTKALWRETALKWELKYGYKKPKAEAAAKLELSGPKGAKWGPKPGAGAAPEVVEELPASPPKPVPKAKPPEPTPEQVAAAPPPAAKPEVLPMIAEDIVLAEQLGPATGTNPGGLFMGSDGVERYVKRYEDRRQVYSEGIANAAYRELGINAPETAMTTFNGQLSIATKIVKNQGELKTGINAARADAVLDSFVADVWLKNWDVIGAGVENTYGNIVITGAKSVARIDQGGALLYRGLTGRKSPSSLGVIDEWEKFFDKGINPTYRRMFDEAGVKGANDASPAWRARVREQYDTLSDVRKSTNDFADLVPDLPEFYETGDRKAILAMLRERHTKIGKKIDDWGPPPKPPPAKAVPEPPKPTAPTTAQKVPFKWEEEMAAALAETPDLPPLAKSPLAPKGSPPPKSPTKPPPGVPASAETFDYAGLKLSGNNPYANEYEYFATYYKGGPKAKGLAEKALQWEESAALAAKKAPPAASGPKPDTPKVKVEELSPENPFAEQWLITEETATEGFWSPSVAAEKIAAVRRKAIQWEIDQAKKLAKAPPAPPPSKVFGDLAGVHPDNPWAHAYHAAYTAKGPYSAAAKSAKKKLISWQQAEKGHKPTKAAQPAAVEKKPTPKKPGEPDTKTYGDLDLHINNPYAAEFHEAYTTLGPYAKKTVGMKQIVKRWEKSKGFKVKKSAQPAVVEKVPKSAQQPPMPKGPKKTVVAQEVHKKVELPDPPPGPAVKQTTSTAALKTKVDVTAPDKLGDVYEDAVGVQRYVKKYTDSSQGYSEAVANNAYQRLGLSAPNSRLLSDQPGWVVNEAIEGTPVSEMVMISSRANQVLDGFVADVWLKNWDTMGAQFDNLVEPIATGQKIVRRNQRGALLFRAGGQRKNASALEVIDEWEQFNLPTSQKYKDVFQSAGVDGGSDTTLAWRDRLEDQFAKLTKLREETNNFADLVPEIQGVAKADHDTILNMLRARHEKIGEKIASIPTAVPSKLPARLPPWKHVFGDLENVSLTNPHKHAYHATYTAKGPYSKAAKEAKQKLIAWEAEKGLKAKKSATPANVTKGKPKPPPEEPAVLPSDLELQVGETKMFFNAENPYLDDLVEAVEKEGPSGYLYEHWLKKSQAWQTKNVTPAGVVKPKVKRSKAQSKAEGGVPQPAPSAGSAATPSDTPGMTNLGGVELSTANPHLGDYKDALEQWGLQHEYTQHYKAQAQAWEKPWNRPAPRRQPRGPIQGGETPDEAMLIPEFSGQSDFARRLVPLTQGKYHDRDHGLVKIWGSDGSWRRRVNAKGAKARAEGKAPKFTAREAQQIEEANRDTRWFQLQPSQTLTRGIHLHNTGDSRWWDWFKAIEPQQVGDDFSFATGQSWSFARGTSSSFGRATTYRSRAEVPADNGMLMLTVRGERTTQKGRLAFAAQYTNETEATIAPSQAFRLVSKEEKIIELSSKKWVRVIEMEVDFVS